MCNNLLISSSCCFHKSQVSSIFASYSDLVWLQGMAHGAAKGVASIPSRRSRALLALPCLALLDRYASLRGGPAGLERAKRQQSQFWKRKWSRNYRSRISLALRVGALRFTMTRCMIGRPGFLTNAAQSHAGASNNQIGLCTDLDLEVSGPSTVLYSRPRLSKVPLVRRVELS